MLVRLWIVLSLLWDFFVIFASLKTLNNTFSDWSVAAILPWGLGIIVWLCWQFIRGGLYGLNMALHNVVARIDAKMANRMWRSTFVLVLLIGIMLIIGHGQLPSAWIILVGFVIWFFALVANDIAAHFRKSKNVSIQRY